MKRRDFVRTVFLFTTAATATATSLSAFARRGRPASPNSVAGVHRRHRRRHRRRVRRRIHRNMTLYSLPYGCSVVRYRGSVKYYYCSGIWYRPAFQGTTVIYIVDEIEAGAETNLEFEEDY